MGAEPSVESHQARWQCYPDLRAGRSAPACPAPPCPLLPPGALRARGTALCAPSPARAARLLGAPGSSRLLWSSEPGRDCRGALRNTPPAAGSPGQWTGFKLGKEYLKAVYYHPAYLAYIQSTSCEMPGWMNHKLESRFLGETSTTSDMQVISPLWQNDFLGGSDGKSVCLQRWRPGFDPRVGKIPWRKKLQPTPVLVPGKSHGRRSLVGCYPWGRKESDTTERLHLLPYGRKQRGTEGPLRESERGE